MFSRHPIRLGFSGLLVDRLVVPSMLRSR
jgi:hypothetical protein